VVFIKLTCVYGCKTLEERLDLRNKIPTTAKIIKEIESKAKKVKEEPGQRLPQLVDGNAD
jgi:hypothetical protein